MATNNNPNKQVKDSNLGTHPDGIDPSAPSVGTEGWGTTPDEKRVLSPNGPQATRDGQMKGNPGDDMATASERQDSAATSNKRPSGSSRQGEVSRDTSGSERSKGMSHSGTTHTFRCSDAGHSDCDWETAGDTQDEIMQKVVEHARDAHGMTDWSDALRDRVRDSIRSREAA